MKHLKFTFLISGFLLMQVNFTFAQWQSDVRLTNNSAGSYTSYNNAWCIASSGNFVHAVWFDNRDGNYEIYYKRSIDGGASWGTDTRLTNNSAISWASSISVSGSDVHVVWYDERHGSTEIEIYYIRSSDGGSSWGAETRLTNNPLNSLYPSIASSGSDVHVVWYDFRTSIGEIFYKRSTDRGISWGQDMQLTNVPGGYSSTPSVAVSGSVVHVVWEDYRDGRGELYYRRSTDGGSSWVAATQLTNDTTAFAISSIAVSDSVVHIVWNDYRDGNNEIYYKRSTDAGISWETDTRLTNSPAISDYPSVSASGQAVHVVWDDNRDGNFEIYYKRSTDGGTSWGTDTRLTNNSAGSVRSSISVSGLKVHVIWFDLRNGSNPEIYYKRDSTGNPIGIININSEIPKEFSLSQNYPNPFNPTTKIRFEISGTSAAQTFLIVYDMLGREVIALVNEELKPGTYEVTFDAGKFSSGIYFYKISAGSFTETKRMILLK